MKQTKAEFLAAVRKGIAVFTRDADKLRAEVGRLDVLMADLRARLDKLDGEIPRLREIETKTLALPDTAVLDTNLPDLFKT
jgi:hypothetical protein